MMLCSMEYTFGQFGSIASLCLLPASSPPWPAVWGDQSEKRRNLNSVQIQFSSSQSIGMLSVKNQNHSIIKDQIKKINFTSARSSTPPTLQWWRNHWHGDIWAYEPTQAAEAAKTQNLHLILFCWPRWGANSTAEVPETWNKMVDEITANACQNFTFNGKWGSSKGSLLVAYLTNIINDSFFLLVSLFFIFAISA